jgi:hypothetical protein
MNGTADDRGEARIYRAIDRLSGRCIGAGVAGRVRARIEDGGIAIEEVELRTARTGFPLAAEEARSILAAATPLRNRLTTQEERDEAQDAMNEMDPDDVRLLKAEIVRLAEGAHAEYPQYLGHWNRWSVGRMENDHGTITGDIQKNDLVLFKATPADPYSALTVYSVRVGADIGLAREQHDAVIAAGSGKGSGDQALAEATQGLLLNALNHDAVFDAVTDLLFEHVVEGNYHWTVVANSLAPILEEIVAVADATDWTAAADHVLDPEAQVADPEGVRGSEHGTDIEIGVIRAFLRVVVDEPAVRELLRHRPEVEGRAVEAPCRAAAVREELSAALRSGTEEDWNIVAGQLISEAQTVCGMPRDRAAA